ncbi:TetR family transcriptional regulator [Williamsia sp. 1138]|uniref:TetR/AcrR family transcriptional regulator n=1 Tax=Williamsia sp. 1138 TaxID=1903117 RepID=UPI000A10C1AC|nr:TetR/AcrR family transcriptional regulator [Williamsia sp. 1138]OZG28687.1 TetR family transcriptional regulator [Williamsia sp. 1138]
MARDTRETILTTAIELMRVHGYSALSMKQIVAGSGAPIGSIYHHFPEGKSQIAREALVNAGIAYAAVIPAVLADQVDLGAGIRAAFAQAAEVTEQTGFANMCPVSTVAGEVANSDDSLRRAAAGVFTDWITLGQAYFESRGVESEMAEEAITAIVCSLEGAFVMARTLRNTRPLIAAGTALSARYEGVALALVEHDHIGG